MSRCCLLVMILLPACPSHVNADTPLDIDELFSKWDREDSPGMAVGVFQNGIAVHKRGYGMANLDESIPVSSASIFDTYSVTKSFTTACIARLLDEGKVSLDDDIRRFVPELPEYASPVRIRHLIRCRSGLRDYLNLMMLTGRSRDDIWNRDDALDLIVRQKATTFTPGEDHSYNNTDFFLLALIVERATGKSVREYASEQLFNPLGMQSTFFDDDRTLPLKNRTVGYGRYQSGQFHRLVMNSSTVGPFGLKTCLDDLVRWDGNFRKNKLTSGKHLNTFFERGSLLNNENCLSSYPGQKHRGVEHVWYTGGGPGFFAHFVRFPKHDLSIAVLCNLSEEEEWFNIVHAIRTIADHYLADHLTAPVGKDDWDEATPVTLPLTKIENRVGGYQKPNGSFVRIELQDETLVLKEINRAFPPSVPQKLTPVDGDRFRALGAIRPFDLIFESSPEGDQHDARIRYRDGRSEKWESVEFATPTEKQLNEYANDYRCDDIESTYQFFVKDNTLFVRFNSGRGRKLIPTTQDVFVPSTGRWDNMRFVFSRNSDGDVEGFRLSFHRMQLYFDVVRR